MNCGQPTNQMVAVAPHQTSNKAGTYRMTAALVVLVGMLLLLVSVFSPWWQIDMEASNEGETGNIHYDFYMGDNVQVDMDLGNLSSSDQMTHDEAGFNGNGVGLGFLIFLGTLLIVLLSFIAMLLYVKDHPSAGNGLVTFSAVLCIVAVVLFAGFYPAMATVPMNEHEPLINSLSGKDSARFDSLSVEMEYGPTTGFYLFIFGFIMLCVAVVLGMMSKKEREQVAPVVTLN